MVWERATQFVSRKACLPCPAHHHDIVDTIDGSNREVVSSSSIFCCLIPASATPSCVSRHLAYGIRAALSPVQRASRSAALRCRRSSSLHAAPQSSISRTCLGPGTKPRYATETCLHRCWLRLLLSQCTHSSVRKCCASCFYFIMTRRVVYGVGLVLTIACEFEDPRSIIDMRSDMCRHGNDDCEYRYAAMDQLHSSTASPPLPVHAC